jgi:predicted CXXCH cytochrome family protein
MNVLRIAGITAGLLALAVGGFLMSASGREAAPEQPIPFSHQAHAGESKIPCLYCHVNARRASVAGIPSVERCMGCHKITAANKPGVQKLKEYWDRKEPIPWQKVTWMPDFVFFEHWPHVRAEIQCQTCHGPVETMDRMRQVRDLSMKFCVSCHRQKKASIDCAVCHR